MLSNLLKSIFRPPSVKHCRQPRSAKHVDLSLSTIVAAAGNTVLLSSQNVRTEIYDLIVQCQNANNTFQIFAGNKSISPLLAFTPGQPATFDGIFLDWADTLYIVAGNNSPIAVNIRYRRFS